MGLEVGFIDSKISDHHHHTPPPTPHTLISSLHFYQLHWCFSIFLLFPNLDPGLLSLICRPLGPDCPLWWACPVHHGTWSSLPHHCAQDPSSRHHPQSWCKRTEVVVQSPSHVWLFASPWTTACQASLSLTLQVCPSPCPLNWWCHPTISSFFALVISCLQSFPASGSFAKSSVHIRWSKSQGRGGRTPPEANQGSWACQLGHA